MKSKVVAQLNNLMKNLQAEKGKHTIEEGYTNCLQSLSGYSKKLKELDHREWLLFINQKKQAKEYLNGEKASVDFATE